MEILSEERKNFVRELIDDRRNLLKKFSVKGTKGELDVFDTGELCKNLIKHLNKGNFWGESQALEKMAGEIASVSNKYWHKSNVHELAKKSLSSEDDDKILLKKLFLINTAVDLFLKEKDATDHAGLSFKDKNKNEKGIKTIINNNLELSLNQHFEKIEKHLTENDFHTFDSYGVPSDKPQGYITLNLVKTVNQATSKADIAFSEDEKLAVKQALAVAIIDINYNVRKNLIETQRGSC